MKVLVGGLTCSFIRFLLAPVPTLMILVANSTPMVCEDKTLHSLFTNRCSKQDLSEGVSYQSMSGPSISRIIVDGLASSGIKKREHHLLARPAWSK